MQCVDFDDHLYVVRGEMSQAPPCLACITTSEAAGGKGKRHEQQKAAAGRKGNKEERLMTAPQILHYSSRLIFAPPTTVEWHLISVCRIYLWIGSATLCGLTRTTAGMVPTKRCIRDEACRLTSASGRRMQETEASDASKRRQRDKQSYEDKTAIRA